MNEPFESGVLISLPAPEWAPSGAPASVFPVQAFDDAGVSTPLRDALDLVGASSPPGRPQLIVARPEMFTDGETLAWLNRAIAGVRDHVALSDGTTVRLVPGLRNHVYFYDFARPGPLEALERLERRAPELFGQLHSQINTALGFRWRSRRFAPQTQVLLAEPRFVGAVLRPFAVEPGQRRRVGATAFDTEPFARLHCLRLSENAFGEPEVARRVTARLAGTLADPTEAMILTIPEGADRAFLNCLNAGGRWPGGLMPNVFFCEADPDSSTLDRLAPRRTLITDAFADFSRAAPDFLESFDKTLVFARRGRHMPAQFHDLLTVVYGPRVEIVWLRPERLASVS